MKPRLLCSVLLCFACGPDIGQGSRALTPVCVETKEGIEEDGWQCGQDRTVECVASAAELRRLYFIEGGGCSDADYVLDDPGPYGPGVHTIGIDRISKVDGTVTDVCESVLTVVDEPPEAESHDSTIWPPNHKLHHISIDDCVTVTDACDADVPVHFTWASSDEPVNGLGDGNHTPDIVLGCDGVDLRAERQGPRNGRVYHLGWRAEDLAGHVVEGTCTVTVHHDQSGRVAMDDGEAYRVELGPDACGEETEPEPDPNPNGCPDPNNPNCL